LPASVMDSAPRQAWGPRERITPIRKPDGFIPAVQRWSAQLPQASLRVAFFAAQGPDAAALTFSGFFTWVTAALERHPDRPTAHDHARFTDAAGLLNHVVTAYWIDENRWAAWAADRAVSTWWEAAERLVGPVGCWREILSVPADRQESIYWLDYAGGLMRSSDVNIYPTPYCGYYGAMRDRIVLAGTDPLEPEAKALQPALTARAGRGERWRIRPPGNLAVIRSANGWGRLDPEQRADYESQLRAPLNRGMDFLQRNATETGCASLRMMTTTGAEGVPEPEQHALGYFLSLRHMENWAEGHATHAAIFSAAVKRYKQYGNRNQLRTWHEVFVLPPDGQLFEYINCHAGTGLLPWFDAEQLA